MQFHIITTSLENKLNDLMSLKSLKYKYENLSDKVCDDLKHFHELLQTKETEPELFSARINYKIQLNKMIESLLILDNKYAYYVLYLAIKYENLQLISSPYLYKHVRYLDFINKPDLIYKNSKFKNPFEIAKKCNASQDTINCLIKYFSKYVYY